MKRTLIKQLIQLSREYGADATHIIAGGGNSSVKDGKEMSVKASGTSMAHMEPEDLLLTDMNKVLAIPGYDKFSDDRDERENQIARLLLDARINPPDPTLRPSVETVLHALFPQTFILHTHSETANAVACSRGGINAFKKLKFPKYVKAAWMEYVDPGLPLAVALRDTLEKYRKDHGEDANVVYMAKHGIIFAGNDPDEVRQLANACERAVKQVAKRADKKTAGLTVKPEPKLPAADQKAAYRMLLPAFRSLLQDSSWILRPINADSVQRMIHHPKGKEYALGGPLLPDQVVYCGIDPLWLPVPKSLDPEDTRQHVSDALDKFRKDHRSQDPKVLLIPGVGAWAASPTLKDTRTVADMYASSINILVGTQAFGGARPLNERERNFIDTWSAEQYRRKKAAAAAGQQRAANQVTLITGAGQGVGKEIAQGMAGQGALVVCLDINPETVQQTATELNQEYGDGSAIHAVADVTNEEQLRAAITHAVYEYGSLDVSIANAGILKAFKVTSFPAETWRKIIDVNLVGVFLCMKTAAEVMQPAHRGNLIQINSKSGKSGSKYNSAYAASKFAGIGLVQSLALDLMEDGIRVNAICPGNFFDLPLWSAPGGLFDQYRKKFDNAPREEVRRIYEEKIPMGRGCRVSDVVKTILYIMEQEYETGQAYNVTGGQQMT